MQVDVPQILWHDNSARVMSLDFYPNSNFLVTGSVMSDEDTGIRVISSKLTFYSSGSSNGKQLQMLVNQVLSKSQVGDGNLNTDMTCKVDTHPQ